jgi:ribonuclease J
MAKQLSVIPLGGVTEIGKNMFVIRYGDDIIIIDSGLMFPEEEMLGIDIVIPDMTYLFENKKRIKGVFLTHGHEDHIGSLSYLLREVDVPVYGTGLTLAIVSSKLEENKVEFKSGLREVMPGDKIKAGAVQVEYIRINHSIPGGAALAVHTPAGIILHSGDFKFDQTPIDGRVADFPRLAELGNKGVLMLICDTTNADSPGYTPSERGVRDTLEQLIKQAEQRVLVTTFASNVHRIQQVIDISYRNGRKVAVAGRSMTNIIDKAAGLGYIEIPSDTIIDLNQIDDYPRDRVTILTTGSQGEPMSALTRIAMQEHKKVDVAPGDLVIISASCIPRNETMVSRTINYLFKRGADVITDEMMEVHVSGHASQEEIKMMINLVRPRYVMPFHGEYRHMAAFTRITMDIGIPKEHVFICEPGDVVSFKDCIGAITGQVTAGDVLVDGLGVGDVSEVVLRDRMHLASYGVVIIVLTVERGTGRILAGPDIISRGFIYEKESEEILEEAKNRLSQALAEFERQQVTDWSAVKTRMREIMSRFLKERTRRRPMLMPIVMEV